MHKRVGSGDMSSLVSNKQSAINKLTRSYDMSIRSLMSEELSLRTLQPTGEAKFRSDSEPIELAHHLLDSKALSPKYLSSSPQTREPAVKLISRGDKPIKKTSPNKDTPGPPQPVKAIHTLPPSLPASRENTFDSLPQKSPLPSDDECKDGTRWAELKSPAKSPAVTSKYVADSLDDVAVIESVIVSESHEGKAVVTERTTEPAAESSAAESSAAESSAAESSAAKSSAAEVLPDSNTESTADDDDDEETIQLDNQHGNTCFTT